MDGAEVYLLLLRKTMIPIVGEAVPIPFTAQIELDGWNWSLVNENQAEMQSKYESAFDTRASEVASKDILKIADNENMPDYYKKMMIERKVKRATSEAGKAGAADAEGAGESGKGKKKKESELKFSFSKSTDAATTQMLNSMKEGEVHPRAVLTLFHRAVNNPVTLAITFKNVRLIDYKLKVDVSDTMAAVKEDWEAEFEQVDYAYQSRPSASGPTLTTGQVRIFKMLSKGLF